jgi:hypothetical protein
VPTRDVDELLGLGQGLGDGGQGIAAVDQDLELAALAGRRVTLGEHARVQRLEHPAPAQVAQPAAVLVGNGGLDSVPHQGVDAVQCVSHRPYHPHPPPKLHVGGVEIGLA